MKFQIGLMRNDEDGLPLLWRLMAIGKLSCQLTSLLLGVRIPASQPLPIRHYAIYLHKQFLISRISCANMAILGDSAIMWRSVLTFFLMLKHFTSLSRYLLTYYKLSCILYLQVKEKGKKMATYEDIKSYDTVNDTYADQVEVIAQSIKENGWQGAPILTYGDYRLITGSHRLEALEALYDDEEVDNELFSVDIAEDVTDIVDAYLAKNDIDFEDIDFADLGGIFEGTWVEQYANEIEEW